MDCEDIKQILPKYFQHQATEEEIKTVEEHLCVCHECRATLGEIMDKLTDHEEAAQPQGAGTEEMQIVPSETPQDSEEKEEEHEESYLTQMGKQQREKTFSQEPAKEKQSMEYIPAEKNPETSSVPGRNEPAVNEPSEPEPPKKFNPPEPEPTYMPPEQKEPEAVFTSDDFLESRKSPGVEVPQPQAPAPNISEPSFQPSEHGKFKLDDAPLDDKKIGMFEYVAIGIGVIVLLTLVVLVLKP